MPGSTARSGEIEASGTFYNSNHSITNSSNFVTYSTSNPATVTGTRSFAYSVQAPQAFITRQLASDWSTTPIITGLWNDSKTPLAATNGSVADLSVKVKSIFDPSPLGFRTPVNGTWDRFDDVGQGASSTIFPWVTNSRVYEDGVNTVYPASGFRYIDDGSLFYSERYGYTASASPYSSDSRMSFMYFNNSEIVPSYYSSGHRAHAFPVRPIQE